MLLAASEIRAAEPGKAHKALLEKVAEKLLAACDAPIGFEWPPPDFQVIVDPSMAGRQYMAQTEILDVTLSDTITDWMLGRVDTRGHLHAGYLSRDVS